MAGDDGKIPFPQERYLCHQQDVQGLAPILVFALVAAVAASALLALAVRRQARRIAALDAEKGNLAQQVERLTLLERREAVCAPFDALWLCWARCVPPDEAHLHAAARAAESAKRLFPADLEPDLDEVCRLLIALAGHRVRQREAIRYERHGERVSLMEEEAEMERLLKPKLSGLRTLLADASRPCGRS